MRSFEEFNFNKPLAKMKTIEINKLLSYYKDNLKGKNWGVWPDSSNWPDVGVNYTISQYGSNGKTYDIIKFDYKVQIDEDTVGRKFILSGQRPTIHTPVQVDGSLY